MGCGGGSGSKEKILGPGHQHLMGQDCIGDHGDRRLDEGRADGQKPNFAFCLVTQRPGDVASSAPMDEREGATQGWPTGSGPPRRMGLHGLAPTNLLRRARLTRSATFDFLWII